MTAHTDNLLELCAMDSDLQGEPANDSSPMHSARWTDANLLVATTVARVSAFLQPHRANVSLGLCPGHPVIAGDSTTLAFALAGVLGALLRSLDADHAVDTASADSTLRVSVGETDARVRITVALPDVPPLGIVRALAGNDHEGADPTVAHCRRLIESCGGTLALADADGVLAFAMVLPRCPLGPSVRLLPPAWMRNPIARTARPLRLRAS
jgi:hypothetical protein